MIQELITALLVFSERIGYWGIILLMSIESSFFPFPSEVVIPPAAYLAHQSKLNIIAVILAGTIGSVIGAIFNYFFALIVGRSLLYKLAELKLIRVFLFSKEKLEKAEKLFLKNGELATFAGRLIPAIRQLISLPAGFSKMNFLSFIFYTSAGSFIWCSVLGVLGYALGANQILLKKYYQEISLILLISGLLFLFYLFFRKKKERLDRS